MNGQLNNPPRKGMFQQQRDVGYRQGFEEGFAAGLAKAASIQEVKVADFTDEIALVQSKTFWAGVAGLVLMTAKSWGVDTHGVDTNSLTDQLFNLATAVAFIATMVFRAKANAKVTGVFKAK